MRNSTYHTANLVAVVLLATLGWLGFIGHAQAESHESISTSVSGSFDLGQWASAKEYPLQRGGLCVIVCRYGHIEPAVQLAEAGPWTVHLFVGEASRVALVREQLEERGLWGRIAAEHWQGDVLPLAENLVNLLLVRDMPLDHESLLRVLAPQGRGVLVTDGEVEVVDKPRPAEMGQWTHPWHGPDGNLVSEDRAMGVLNSYQWLAGPPVPLGPRKGSDGALLSAGGRVFYVTQNVLANMPEGGADFLVARDAFNGAVLWSRSWGRAVHGGPSAVNETIVIDDERVYGAFANEVVVLEAASGRLVDTWPLQETPDKLVLSDGRVVVQARDGLYAFDAAEGTSLWQYQADNINGLVAAGGQGFCLTSTRAVDGRWQHDLVAIDMNTGDQQWVKRIESEHGAYQIAMLRIHFATDDVIALLERRDLRMLSTEDGRELWRRQSQTESRSSMDSRQVGHFYRDGEVWMRVSRLSHEEDPELWLTLDPQTGEVNREVRVKGLVGHAKTGCQRMTATQRFAIDGRTAASWCFDTGERNAWSLARGGCVIGAVPANSMAYITPNACGCLDQQIRGTIAIAHSTTGHDTQRPGPLQPGPAYDVPAAEEEQDDALTWPTYRRDSQRSAYLPAKLEPAWRQAWQASVMPAAENYADYDGEASKLPQLPSVWKLRKDPENVGVEKQWYQTREPDDNWEDIPVPAWYHQAGHGRYQGYAWYHVEFDLPRDIDDDILINFGAVDEQAWIYLNGQLIGENSASSTGRHPGELYVLAFSVVADQDVIRPGETNTLVVRVHNHAGAGGIYQPVNLSLDQGLDRAYSDAEWKLNVGQALSSLVASHSQVMLAIPQRRQVVALDTDTGAEQWRFTAGGRITAPPTLYQGLAMFGSHDGYVYALRAQDGELVWRRRAAPADRRIMAYGQLESSWPVQGGVLVKDGVAVVAAGRSSDGDGGMVVHGFDPHTGQVHWSRRIARGQHGVSDLLVSDGSDVYLINQRLDVRTGEVTELAFERERVGGRGHLVNPDEVRYLRSGLAGFFNTSWTALELALRKHMANWTWGGSVGEILAFDGEHAFAFQLEGVAWGSPFTKGGGLIQARDETTGAELWQESLPAPAQVTAMLLTTDVLYLAGPEDRSESNGSGFLLALDRHDGSELMRRALPAAPTHDGIVAADKRMFIALSNGSVLGFEPR